MIISSTWKARVLEESAVDSSLAGVGAAQRGDDPGSSPEVLTWERTSSFPASVCHLDPSSPGVMHLPEQL